MSSFVSELEQYSIAAKRAGLLKSPWKDKALSAAVLVGCDVALVGDFGGNVAAFSIRKLLLGDVE